VAGDYAEDLAAQMLATILGIKFDADQSYDERLDLWKLSEKIVQTQNITQTGVGQNNLWTTVLAAAVLLQ
jgi:arginine decarboxylase